MDTGKIKNVALSAAKEAGQIILDLAKKDIKYDMKNAHDILAEADLKSEKIIISKIKENFPDHSILSEEYGEENNKSDYLWIIDPVDGTINYSRKIDEYSISIAVENKDEIIFGLIYQPELNKMFYAEKDKGAYLNDKKIKVSDVKEHINMLLATDNSSHIDKRKENFGVLFNICPEFRHIRIFGSAALHLARVACGNIDVYYKIKFSYHDFGAGILIIKEAGGKVTDLDGSDISKNSIGIVASNGLDHDRIIEIIK